MREFVKERVSLTDSTMVTDGYRGYSNFKDFIPHEVIVHWKAHKKGDAHTNSIESFWALAKRSLHGTYHAVRYENLQAYFDEFCFRYNLRNWSPVDAFEYTIRCALETPPLSTKESA